MWSDLFTREKENPNSMNEPQKQKNERETVRDTTPLITDFCVDGVTLSRRSTFVFLSLKPLGFGLSFFRERNESRYQERRFDTITRTQTLFRSRVDCDCRSCDGPAKAVIWLVGEYSTLLMVIEMCVGLYNMCRVFILKSIGPPGPLLVSLLC